MNWLLLSVCCVAFIELFHRLGTLRYVHDLSGLCGKVCKTIRSQRISDHWKQRVLQRYAWDLFSSSMLLFITLLITIAPFFIVTIGSDYFVLRFETLIMSIEGIVGSTVIAVSYFVLRPRFV